MGAVLEIATPACALVHNDTVDFAGLKQLDKSVFEEEKAMEEKFLVALAAAREKAAVMGVRIRPVETMEQAHRILSGHRESDGFNLLAQKGQLGLSLEALATKKQFTALFSDEEVNNALDRLLSAGYSFH